MRMIGSAHCLSGFMNDGAKVVQQKKRITFFHFAANRSPHNETSAFPLLVGGDQLFYPSLLHVFPDEVSLHSLQPNSAALVVTIESASTSYMQNGYMQQCTPTCQHAVYTKSTRCMQAGHLVVITSRQCTMYTRGQNSYNTRLSTHMHVLCVSITESDSWVVC